MKCYNLFVHWKQGDDFGGELQEHPVVSDALRSWADRMDCNAKQLRDLASLFDGKSVSADADCNHIGLCGDDEVLGIAVKKGLIQQEDDTEEEEEEEDDDELAEVSGEEDIK